MKSDTTIDLADKIPGAEITYGEVTAIGFAMLSWVAAVTRLGHVSPASTLDYMTQLDHIPALIVRDFVAWTSGRLDTVPGSPEERLRELLHDAGWESMLMANLDVALASGRSA